MQVHFLRPLSGINWGGHLRLSKHLRGVSSDRVTYSRANHQIIRNPHAPQNFQVLRHVDPIFRGLGVALSESPKTGARGRCRLGSPTLYNL